MQRLIYIIFASFFLLLSCAKGKPDGILSEEKMSKLMTDVSLIDGYLNSLPIDSGKRVMPVLYDKVFKQYEIDSATFILNLDYYLGNPQLTEKIYKVVGVNLTNYDQDLAFKDSVRNAFVQDSIQKIDRIREDNSFVRNMILSYHRDSSAYTYQQNAQQYFHHLKFNVNAYGTQIPLQSIPNAAEVPPAVSTETTPEDIKPLEENRPIQPGQELQPVEESIVLEPEATTKEEPLTKPVRLRKHNK